MENIKLQSNHEKLDIIWLHDTVISYLNTRWLKISKEKITNLIKIWETLNVILFSFDYCWENIDEIRLNLKDATIKAYASKKIKFLVNNKILEEPISEQDWKKEENEEFLEKLKQIKFDLYSRTERWNWLILDNIWNIEKLNEIKELTVFYMNNLKKSLNWSDLNYKVFLKENCFPSFLVNYINHVNTI